MARDTNSGNGLAGQVVFVTGAARGIGEATSRELVRTACVWRYSRIMRARASAGVTSGWKPAPRLPCTQWSGHSVWLP